jgi:diguanylate cyclase (GGDEF)-like protein
VPLNFLAQVLGQSKQIQELIARTAVELSSANTAVGRQDPLNLDPRPAAAGAREGNQAVISRLQDASEGLRAVNQALQGEIRDRTMVDLQLAAAVEQEEASRNDALHDHLTGLPNRVLFQDRLDHGLAHARRHQCILAVMFVDLDNFKNINDAHGHSAGDAVLQAVAARLARTMRIDDTVSRYGGDEFLCLLTPLREQQDIANIAAKALEAIQAPCDVRVGDCIVNLGLEASIGVSVFPQDGATAAALIARADEAMYRAKENQSGVAFAQDDAAPFAGAVTHRLPRKGGVSSRNATPRAA